VPPVKLEEFWILWCPTAEPPPRVRFSSEEAARKSAEVMAERHLAEFIVLKSVASVHVEKKLKWVEQKGKSNGKSR